MQGELSPERMLAQIDKGQIYPVCLLYGEGEFRMERLLHRMRENTIPESARDLNLHLFYGGKPGTPEYTSPGKIIDTACSLPFLSEKRLIIIRRTDDFPQSEMDEFVRYLEEPVESTSIVFQASKVDFRKRFFKEIKRTGITVNFRPLYDNQVVPWILRLAKEKGLSIDRGACEYLQEIVGNKLRDLNSELEKIHLLFGNSRVGVENVKSVAIHSRKYTVFELMDEISNRNCARSISYLKRFLEEEDSHAPLGLLGMLERQIRLLWQTLAVLDGGGLKKDVATNLHLQPFQVDKLMAQLKNWHSDELEKALDFLHEADGHLKSGQHADIILENLILTLCI
jgi:DNA polymerase-3 subunit delta